MAVTQLDLPYRPCVGIMVINSKGLVFIGKRRGGPEHVDATHSWQMPQGGVDDGEDLEPAALRELGEEVGVTLDHVEMIARLPQELFYDLPPELQGKLWKGKYKGQRQSWFLFRFIGTDSDIVLDRHHDPEFCEWKWVDPALLPELIVPFKREVYQAIVAGFRDKL